MNKQKGISQIVIMVVMLVLAIALPITTKLVQQVQENRSKAESRGGCSTNGWCVSDSTKCSGRVGESCYGGVCCYSAGGVTISPSECDPVGLYCNLGNVYTKCYNASPELVETCKYGCSNAKCNSAPSIPQDSQCKNVGGTCQSTSTSCNGSFLTGYCPSSGSTIKCCKPSSGGITQDAKCTNVGGKCQSTSTSCNGTFLTDYCPSSGSTIKCCKPGCTSDTQCPDYQICSSNKCVASHDGYACSRNTQCLQTSKCINGKCATPINGVCGTTRNSCTKGTLQDITDTSTRYIWNCIGQNGGVTAACSLSIPIVPTAVPTATPTPVNGACGASNNSCTKGTLQDVTDTATQYKWNCVGQNKGTTANCSLNIPATAAKINIKMAFAGVLPGNDSCATKLWPVTLKMVNQDSKDILSTNLNGIPQKTSEKNSKGEIIYTISADIANVPSAGLTNLALFIGGPKHLSIKYGVNKQNAWYIDYVGKLGVKIGDNNYDFSEYPLLAGDVTGSTAGVPDGKIDGRDFSYIKQRTQPITVGTEGQSLSGDIDGNCQVNSGDVRLIKQSMIEIHGQIY